MPPARFLLLGGEPQPESGYCMTRLQQGIYARPQSSQGCRVELRDARFVPPRRSTICFISLNQRKHFNNKVLPILDLLSIAAFLGTHVGTTQGSARYQPSAQGKNCRRAAQCLEPGNGWNCHKDLNLSLVAPSGPAPLNVGIPSWGRRQHFTHGVELTAPYFNRRLHPLEPRRCR